MSKAKLLGLGIVLLVIAVVASQSLFTVDQRVQALVMQFGEHRRTVQDPGLNWKVPFVQNVVMYDHRILDLDPPSEEVILSDQKRINVDAFVRYRIVDPFLFYKSVRTELGFRDRFGGILNSAVRLEMGKITLSEVLSEKRDDIMARIQLAAVEAGTTFGVEVVDVRIGRTELPVDISNNVYQRMRSEREREANQLRAEGEELKLRIESDADRQQVVILAEAKRSSEILRGTGDAERTTILGEAYGKDVTFFSLYRSLQAAQTTLGGEGTSMVLSPDSDLLKFLKDLSPK